MAIFLPRSTGLHSYTVPFLCRAHSRGIMENRLCMVTNATFVRAASNIRLTDDRWLCPAIDATLELTPMDEIVHMPVMQSFEDSLGSMINAFQEDNKLTDYLGMLSGRTLHDNFYLGPRARMAWSLTKANFDSMLSTDSFAQFAASTAPGRMVSKIMRNSSAF